MKKVVTFGEVMLRLQPEGHKRLVQGGVLQTSFAGAEANVAVSVSNLGIRSEFVTSLPAGNPLTTRCLNELRGYGVETSHVVLSGARIGTFYMECGSNMRPSKVFYDRENSSIATLPPGSIDWEEVLRDATWFHWSGITPAISDNAAKNCLDAIRTANKLGVCVSCDINYRGTLWKYGKTASEVMPELVACTDVIIGNEEDCYKVFGIQPAEFDAEKTGGEIDACSFIYVCSEMQKRFPRAHTLALTLRGAISADHNTWQAVLYRDGQLYNSARYNLTDIVDRVGAGDSFSGSLIYALSSEMEPQCALEFATAASALKHTIVGDYNCVTHDEVMHLVKGGSSGRVSR